MPKVINLKKHRSSLSQISSNIVGVGASPTDGYSAPTATAEASSALSLHPPSPPPPQQSSNGGKRLSLDSNFSKQVKRWDERFDELVKFKVLFGSCRVPHRYPDNPGLSRWVVYMRSSYQAGNLPADRIKKLNEIGFIWSDRGHTTWDTRLAQLERYKTEHGTIRVNCSTAASSQLWRWGSVQRANYRLGKLSESRIRALDALGFIWDVDQHDWECKFDDLSDFYRTFGHTRLPNKEPYKKLFLWARVQRTKFHDKSLSADRVAKLQKLDFGWEKNSMYTSSTGHVAMDAGDDGSQESAAVSPPTTGDAGPHGAYSVTRLMPTTSKIDETSTFASVPKVSIMKSPPASSKKNSAGFDRLLQLAELARQFSPVPMSPVRPFRP